MGDGREAAGAHESLVMGDGCDAVGAPESLA